QCTVTTFAFASSLPCYPSNPLWSSSLFPLVRSSPFSLLPHPARGDFYTLSLHDALPILCDLVGLLHAVQQIQKRSLDGGVEGRRSEEHTSELQSRFDLVCRLLLEKKNRPFARAALC